MSQNSKKSKLLQLNNDPFDQFLYNNTFRGRSSNFSNEPNTPKAPLSNRSNINKRINYNDFNDKMSYRTGIKDLSPLKRKIYKKEESILSQSESNSDYDIDINNILSEIEKAHKDVNLLLEQNKNQFNVLLIKQDEDTKIRNELKILKSLRNKLITEKSVLVNELDFHKSTQKSGRILSSGNISNTQSNYDQIIDNLENELSLLKLENAKFFENIDFLNDEVYVNQDNNKILKSKIKEQDKIIKNLKEEKNRLESYLSRCTSEI